MWSSWLTALLIWSLLYYVAMVRSTEHGTNPPEEAQLTSLFPHRSFNATFSAFFGGPNIQLSSDGMGVDIILNNYSGSGFVSKDKYYYGFFSTAMKLPANYSAGVVVAFYMSNADVYPHNHDEIDFELLGHEERKEWTLQTNLYGNGSVSTGREEKFRFWFDPTEEFHHYSIIWNHQHIVFLVDNIPIREVNHGAAISGVYPSKPTSLFSTIWDGSDWATHGGKKPVDYNFSPFLASFKEMEMDGCIWSNTTTTLLCSENGQADPVEGQDFIRLSEQQKVGMDWVRQKFMFYSYCNDPGRYKVPPPECPHATTNMRNTVSRQK